MSENPNPRGWATDDLRMFIDLGTVAFVGRAGDDKVSYVVPTHGMHLDSVGAIPMTRAEHDSLVRALLVYRSGR